MATTPRQWLDRLRALNLPRRFKVMNVCGGHERTIAMTGLRKALPDNVELVPGPGCPVCICPEEIVHQAIQLALSEKVILVAFGDFGHGSLTNSWNDPIEFGKRILTAPF